MGGEIADDFQRFEMIHRLMNGWHEKERLLAEEISHSFSKRTGLPAFVYKGPNAVKVGKVPGVWGRNLLANRIYSCPVVFFLSHMWRIPLRHINIFRWETTKGENWS